MSGMQISRRGGSTAVLLVALLSSASGAGPLQAQEDRIGIALGAVPPAVEIEDLDGNPVDLGDYIGKGPVLLEFWATWCPLCQALEPQLQAAHAKYGEQVEFLILAVAVNQSKGRVRRHMETHSMPGRVLWDTEGRAVRAFMTPSTSYVVVLDAVGKVVYTGVGEDQDIEAALARALRRRG